MIHLEDVQVVHVACPDDLLPAHRDGGMEDSGRAGQGRAGQGRAGQGSRTGSTMITCTG